MSSARAHRPMKKSAGLTVHLDDAPGAGFGWWIAFNQSKKPFSDQNFRQAISYAIDYKRLVSLWNGIAQQSQGPYRSPSPHGSSAADSLQYNQDLRSDRSDEEGRLCGPDHPPMKVSLTCRTDSPSADMGTLIKEDLLKLGIELDIQAKRHPRCGGQHLEPQLRHDLLQSRTATRTRCVRELPARIAGMAASAERIPACEIRTSTI